MYEHQDSDSSDEHESTKSVTDVASTDQSSNEYHPLWCGYKIVGDNVDKNIKPRYERFEIKSQSLHYFHAYAGKDIIDMTFLCDSQPAPTQLDSTSLTPSSEDISTIQDEMCTLLSR